MTRIDPDTLEEKRLNATIGERRAAKATAKDLQITEVKQYPIPTQAMLDLEMTRFRIEQKYFANLQRGFGHKQKKNK